MIGIDAFCGIDYTSMVSSMLKGVGSGLGGDDQKKTDEAKKKAEEEAKAAKAQATLYRNIAIGGGVAALVYLIFIRKPAPQAALVARAA